VKIDDDLIHSFGVFLTVVIIENQKESNSEGGGSAANEQVNMVPFLWSVRAQESQSTSECSFPSKNSFTLINSSTFEGDQSGCGESWAMNSTRRRWRSKPYVCLKGLRIWVT